MNDTMYGENHVLSWNRLPQNTTSQTFFNFQYLMRPAEPMVKCTWLSCETEFQAHTFTLLRTQYSQ